MLTKGKISAFKTSSIQKQLFRLIISNFQFFTFFFLICNLQSSICNLYAQLPTQEWVARYPGPSNDVVGPFLQVDKFGNSYVAGTHVINDSINILCVKYNTSGIQQWATLYKYPGEGYFAPMGIALDTFGNAYVISDYGQGFSSPLNGLIVKFNNVNGSPVWAKRYIGEYGWSAFNDIKIDRLNNIYAAGWSDTSHLVIRYNTNGDSVWVRKYHPPAPSPYIVYEIARACTIDDSLNIVFTGRRIFNNPSFGSVDSVLTAKYSSSGVLRWESTYFYSITANVGEKITSDQNGNIYVGGGTAISGFGVYLTMKYDRNGARQWTKIYDAPGSGDNILRSIAMDRINNAVFVTGGAVANGVGVAATIKYNALTGDSVWVRRDTGTYRNAGARDITIDTQGNSYITGSTNNIPPGSAVDILTIKYSLQGNMQWFITYNGPFNGWDGGSALELDNLSNIYILGTSQSSSQVSDYIIIKYSQVLGIHVLNNETPQVFKLEQNYPNPFNSTSKFKIQIAPGDSRLSFVKVIVYDVLGRETGILVNEQLKPGTYEVPFEGTNYPSGVYFYQMIADGIIVDTKKLVIAK